MITRTACKVCRIAAAVCEVCEQNVQHPGAFCTILVAVQVDAGVDKDLVFGDPTAPRFVYWEKKLRATPSGPDALTFDLLSIWGKIRAGLGAVGLVKGGPMPGQQFPSFLCFIKLPCVTE